MDTCWICGNVAETREHRIKASDLRKVFGKVDQSTPLFTKTAKVRTLQSVRSNYAKFETKICHQCNTTTTQPYDKAWEKLTKYLLDNQDTLGTKSRLNAGKIYKGYSKQGILNCHLYILKVFGCKIIDDGMPFDLSSFSDCILNGKAHPNVYFSVDKSLELQKKRYAATSQIQVIESKNSKEIYYAAWYYIIGKVSIKILYFVQRPPAKVHGKMIHPSNCTKILRITG